MTVTFSSVQLVLAPVNLHARAAASKSAYRGRQTEQDGLGRAHRLGCLSALSSRAGLKGRGSVEQSGEVLAAFRAATEEWERTVRSHHAGLGADQASSAQLSRDQLNAALAGLALTGT